MLRIAECSDSFLPVTDGVGRVAFEYANALGRLGHECYVVTPQVNAGYRGAYPFEIVDYVSVQKFSVLPQYRPGAAALDLHYLSRADALLLDVVHTHSPGVAGMEAARLSERLHVPLVGTFHPRYFDDFFGGNEPDSLSNAARFALDYYNRCDEVWAADGEAAERLLRLGLTAPVEVVTTGTHTARLEPRLMQDAIRAFHIDERPVLLCVGRLERAKELERLLDMAALLMQSGAVFQLLFVGAGREEERLRAEIRARDLMGVARLLGRVSDPATLDALYANAVLCLFPWHSVSVGQSVGEAAGQHTPSLVLSGSASARGVIAGSNGLIAPDSPADMALAVQTLLSDPARARRMGDEAAATIPVPWERVIERALERFDRLAGMDKAKLVRKRGPFRRELMQFDQSLNKRTFDVMLKFLSQDLQHIYAYPYRRNKLPCAPVIERTPLMRATPESQGVSSGRIAALIDALHADPGADAHSLLVLRHGRVIAEADWPPYSAAYPHQLYSLSKSVTGMAVGMLADEGGLSLSERLVDIFPESAPPSDAHPANAFTVRQLLTMSTGSQFNEIGSALGADWVGEFLRAGTKFPAGEAFDYNSLNTYLLAAVVRKKTGLTLTEYLRPRLYEPLGIPFYEWETAPDGTEKGGWGLSLTIESVAKLGQLYLNGGTWTVNGETRRIISHRWIEESTRVQIPTPDGEITFGYGYQMWMTSHPGAFLFNGAFGQYMLALPDLDALVVLFSGTARLFAQGGVMDYVDTAFANASDTPLVENGAAQSALAMTASALTMRYRPQFYDPDRTPLPFAALTSLLDNRVYTFDANVGGLLPVVLMSVSNNFASGVRSVAFRRESNGILCLEWNEGARILRLNVRETGYTQSTVTARDDTYAVMTSCQAESVSETEWMLHLNVHFIETPFARVLHFLFRGDAVTLVLDEYPTVRDASEMLMVLAGVTKQQAVRALMPLLRRDQLQHALKTFTTTTVQGKL